MHHNVDFQIDGGTCHIIFKIPYLTIKSEIGIRYGSIFE